MVLNVFSKLLELVDDLEILEVHFSLLQIIVRSSCVSHVNCDWNVGKNGPD